MKAGIFFTGSGPIVVLTSYASLTAPNFVEKLAAKGISKFIAYGADLEEVKRKYGKHFDVIMKDLHQTDDLRVLDYDGHRVFRNFTLGKLGQPIFHEPYHSALVPPQRPMRNEAAMIETHHDVIREKHLPRVGDTVHSKKYGTSWRVIEKREIMKEFVRLNHTSSGQWIKHGKNRINPNFRQRSGHFFNPSKKAEAACTPHAAPAFLPR